MTMIKCINNQCLSQDFLPAVCNPPPGEHPLQEEDLQGRFNRHLQPRGPAHCLRAARGEQCDASFSPTQTQQ